MEQSKRENLEAAGFKVGTIEDFLEPDRDFQAELVELKQKFDVCKQQLDILQAAKTVVALGDLEPELQYECFLLFKDLADPNADPGEAMATVNLLMEILHR